jgi:hypothetical protein
MFHIILLCTSRGKGLKDLLSQRIDEILIKETQIHEVIVSGGKISQLTARGNAYIQTLPAQDIKLVVVIGGYCDITKKIRQGGYEEVIFQGPVDTIVENIQQEILYLTSTLNSIPGVHTVFSTIISGNISIWNQTRLAQKKTTHLIHTSDYSDMQDKIHDCINLLNSFIVETNLQNSTITAFTDRLTRMSRKKKSSAAKQTYKFSYINLVDGVHMNEKYSQKLADAVFHAIQININELFRARRQPLGTSSDNKSSDRSWRP